MSNEPESFASAHQQVTEEVELLRRVAGGDEPSFARLYDRFARPLFSVAQGILRDVLVAEEVLQEVFVQIWERAIRYDPRCGKPLTWAIVLTRNKCIDRLRAQQRRSRLIEMIEQSGDQQFMNVGEPVSHELLDRERIEAMRRAMKELPAEQRLAIELAFLGGLTQTEIAGRLELPLGTVKARIRRGMLQLRSRLEAAKVVEDRLAQN